MFLQLKKALEEFAPAGFKVLYSRETIGNTGKILSQAMLQNASGNIWLMGIGVHSNAECSMLISINKLISKFCFDPATSTLLNACIVRNYRRAISFAESGWPGELSKGPQRARRLFGSIPLLGEDPLDSIASIYT
jgi:hypothetical protein